MLTLIMVDIVMHIVTMVKFIMAKQIMAQL
jgi:hypothetical protein